MIVNGKYTIFLENGVAPIFPLQQATWPFSCRDESSFTWYKDKSGKVKEPNSIRKNNRSVSKLFLLEFEYLSW